VERRVGNPLAVRARWAHGRARFTCDAGPRDPAVKLRISSTKNIQKITKSMKMIASTKLVRAQREMQRARVYGSGTTNVLTNMGVKAPEAQSGKGLMIAVSSDKGLCGGIHSNISRGIRPIAQANQELELVSIGDKCKAQLARQFSNRLVGSFSGLGAKPATFTEASLIANVLLKDLGAGEKYDFVQLAYNQFQSAIAYNLRFATVPTAKTLLGAEKIDAYEAEDDVLQNLQEFTVANSIFAAMSDGYAAEIAAKMTAMDNATRNAGDLINRLSIVYNRTRQAVITVELIEIISGAAAV